MFRSLNNSFVSFIRGLDWKLEQKLHRILPLSLTTRYVLGLGCVALLTIMAYVTKEISLQAQYLGFSQIKLTNEQLDLSRQLSRSLLQLKVSDHEDDLKNHMATIVSILPRLESTTAQIADPGFIANALLGDRNRFDDYVSSLSSDSVKLNADVASLRRVVLDKSNYRRKFLKLNTDARQVIDRALLEEYSFRTTTEQMSRAYESRMHERVGHFRVVELVFLLFILGVLIFEALYVFRPAVKQVYEALDTRTKFLSRMGHEIRNPMNSILGMIRLLQDTKVSEQQERYINVLSSSSNSLLSLLNNLVDYTKIKSGKLNIELKEFNLLHSIQSSIDLVTYKIDEKNLDFVFYIDLDTPLKVVSDTVVLQQILLNLLGNSVKFTESGGITVKVWSEKKDADLILHFNVTDTGIGIGPHKLDEIFEYFQQEDSTILRRYGGSGLGLSICAELVKMMGGEIDVKSDKGAGTTMHFTIPVKSYGEEKIADRFEKEGMKDCRAFLADPHPERQKMLQSYVEVYGGSAIPWSSLNIPLDNEAAWLDYFRKNTFDTYILGYDQFFCLIPILAKVQAEFRSNILSKLVLLVRSTLPSSKLVELNSLGIKSFVYLPIKPYDFLNSLDFAMTKKKINKLATRRSEKAAPPVELAKQINVLIVDDSKDNQFIIKSYIERHAGRITFANDGVEAVEKFEQGTFDIVFMDILMPEMDGYEAARRMRDWEQEHNKKPTPLVAVTAYTAEEDLLKCKEAGFSSHISKPVDLGELQSFLAKEFGTKVITPKVVASQGEFDKVWQEKIKEYLPNYLRQRREDLNSLKNAALSEDWSTIMSIGHKIKGSAATYGFPELGEVGAELEKNAAEKKLYQVQVRIESMERWLKENSQH